jgi:hypothetical protein
VKIFSPIITGSSFASGGFDIFGTISASTGPNTVGFYGTASWAQSTATASYVDPLNQILFITGGIEIINTTSTPSLTIKSGSTQVLTVTGSGVTVFGTYNYIPPSEGGGIYFDGNEFYLGY